MPYICLRRADIPNGVLQVLDLVSNTSQRNLIYDPVGQTKYVNRVQNDAVRTTVTGTVYATSASYSGLSVYLLEHVRKGGLAAGTGALTYANANTIALAIIAAQDAGSAMTLSAVNALIAATAASSELTSAGGSASTGALADVLKILAGGEYVCPSGTTVQTAGVFSASARGAFTATQYRSTYDGGGLAASVHEGALSKLIASTFSYGGTTGAAVVVYTDAGAVY